ncbi:hypothetical protein DH2020_045773 [Rehmannia glutinosa]|uniref:Retrovirus-related Pol polyprotein from transposon RE1 n=1 Tax=Rehmannia glutinosa TaxID=99300 RepID=A0ABR0UE50_REHGL
MGELTFFLGLQVKQLKDGTFISQTKYTRELMKKFGMEDSPSAKTPVDLSLHLAKNRGEPVSQLEYARVIGSLMYLTHARPDIAYAVSVVSQFMHNPKDVHLQAVHWILHYLKASPGKGIIFRRNKRLILEAYTDTDYGGSLVDRKSTTGYCTFLVGNLVTWRSKKKNVVARSSAEAEFRAMAQGICELLWLKIILDDLKIKWDGPMRLYCDNNSAISIAHNPVQHDRTKHIEIDGHFIKEKLESGLICTPYVSSGNQFADVLTKGLNSATFHQMIAKLGMEDSYSPA